MMVLDVPRAEPSVDINNVGFWTNFVRELVTSVERNENLFVYKRGIYMGLKRHENKCPGTASTRMPYNHGFLI